MRGVTAFALQVRDPGLLRHEPPLGIRDEAFGPRQQLIDDELGMGLDASQRMS